MPLDPKRQTRSQTLLLRLSQQGSVFVLLIGVVVLIGWILNSSWMRGFSPRSIAMNPLTAILFIVSALALRRRLPKGPGAPFPKLDGLTGIAGFVVALAGALKVAEYVFGFDFQLDQFLFRGRLHPQGLFPENAIAPNTALNLLLCGLGLLLLNAETRRGICPAQFCFLLAGLVSLLALIGYSYGVVPLYRISAGAVPMALSTAIAFGALCTAGLAARPESGVMAVITSDTTAGTIARRLLPATILIPFTLGALRFSGERHGWFDVEVGVSLAAVANMVIFAGLIWWNARLLLRAEEQRIRAERRLAVQYNATRVLAEATDLGEAMGKILKTICETLDYQTGAFWGVDQDANLIRCEQVFVMAPELQAFAENSRRASFPPGTGLPGQIWQQREPLWISDVTRERDFSRAHPAAQAGLRSGLGLPIRCDDRVCGVLEFFSTRSEALDESLLHMVSGIGSQIGQFIERKMAEEHLKQTSSDLARSNTELQQFAYVASHDLSEPLRMIVSYLQLLMQRHSANLNEEAREFIGYAVDGAERLQKLMQDLLTYARVDRREREFERTDCGEVLNTALTNLKLTIDEAGAVIEREPLPTVRGDPLQLTQVFQNLISNAIKFRGQAAPRLSISARRDGAEWIFTVQDNGIGIEPKNFERIFNLFQRLHTRQEYSGTGIGLAICKKIIERHGGRIWVESVPGQGAAFRFTLPSAES